MTRYALRAVGPDSSVADVGRAYEYTLCSMKHHTVTLTSAARELLRAADGARRSRSSAPRSSVDWRAIERYERPHSVPDRRHARDRLF